MVKSSKKSLLGVFALLIAVGLILLQSNVWKNFIINRANETLSPHGWTMDIGNISGHLLGKTQFSNITLIHSELEPIYIQTLDMNIGILKSLFGLPTLDLLFAESVSFDLSNEILKFKSKSAIKNVGISMPLNIKSFYCSGDAEMISDKKEIKIKTIIAGELVGGTSPEIFFDLLRVDLLHTPFQEMNFKGLELSYSDSKFQLKNLIGTFLGLPLTGSVSIDNNNSLIEGKVQVDDFTIPEELFSKLPLKAKFSNFSGIFDFHSDLHTYFGELSLTNNLGLNMTGEFKLEQFNNKSWALKNLLLQGENSQLLISGLLSQSGRLNSYLNLENLDLSRWLDNEISTNLTGLAILDGGITSNGSLEQIDLTLEVLETKYFEVGETSFHGQVSYKDSIISTASPAMLLIGNSQLTLDGSLDFATENLDIIADLENADIQLVNQFWPGNFNSGKATGRMQISGPYTTPSATAELLCNNIVYGNFFLESIEFNSKMDVANDANKGNVGLKVGKGTWKDNSFQSGTVDAIIDNGKVVIENCHFKSGNDFFQFSGEYDGLNSYMVDRIQIAYEKNYLVNSRPVSFSLMDSSLQIDPFEFHINDGILEGIVTGGSNPEGHIKMSNFDASVISHFISDERLNISGIVFGEILGRTKNNGFELDVDLSLKKGMYMQEPFDEMAVSFLYKDGVLHMDDISMTRGQSMGLQANGIIPVMKDKNKNIPISLKSTFTNLPLSFVNNFVPDFYKIGGSATGSLHLGRKSRKGKLFGFPDQTQFSYDIEISDAVFDIISLGQVKGSGKYDGNYLYVDTLNSIRGNEIITAKGSVPFDFNISSKNFGGFFPEGILDFQTKGNLHSLYFLSPYISDLDSVRGDIEIELSMEGPAESIQRNGKISVQNGAIYTLLIDDAITKVNGEAEMVNNQLLISTLYARAFHPGANFPKPKSSNVKISGLMDFSQFFSPGYDLKIKARNASFETLPLDLTAIANIDAIITGKDTVSIDGTIDVLDATLFYEFATADIGESITDESGPVMMYDLTIPIRNQALFQNSQVDAKVSGELRIKHDGNHDMNFDGQIIVEDGNVFSYKDSFEELKGYITFDNKGFNPYMDLVAFTDIDNERINLGITGEIDDLDIILESQSGYSEGEILELLTWGQRFEGKLSSEGFGKQTKSILGSLFENQLEKNIKDFTLLDDIDISGTASLINRGSSDENFEVTAKRKIGDKTYLNLSYKRSFSLDNKIGGGVEYKLNKYFSVVGYYIDSDDEEKENKKNLTFKYRYRYAY